MSTVVELAPLGLDFEMPEEGLWVIPGVDQPGLVSDAFEMMYWGFLSEGDAEVIRLRVAVQNGLSTGTPELTTYDKLRNRAVKMRGVILADREWNELHRRYWA